MKHDTSESLAVLAGPSDLGQDRNRDRDFVEEELASDDRKVVQRGVARQMPTELIFRICASALFLPLAGDPSCWSSVTRTAAVNG